MKDRKGRKLRENELQRKDGRYCYQYSFEGKRYSVYSWRLVPSDKTPTGKKEKPSLRELEEQIQKDLLNGVKITGKKVTVSEYLKQYLEYNHSVSDFTLYHYKSIIRSTVDANSFGQMVLGDVKPSDVVRLYSKMLHGGLSFGYTSTLQGILYPAFQLAVDDNVLERNPCEDALNQFSSKAVKRIREALTRGQQKRLFKFLKEENKNERDYMIFAIFLGTGIRLGEFMGLTWDEVDLDNSCIYIRHQIIYKPLEGKRAYFSGGPKYNEVRRIPIQKNLLELLKTYHEQTFEDSMNSGVSADGLNGFLFWSPRGTPITARIISHLFHKIETRYNKMEMLSAAEEKRPPLLLPNLTPHVFRHTYCTRMAEAGMDIDVLQAVMGHKDASVTMDIYNHADRDRVLSQLDKINRIEL